MLPKTGDIHVPTPTSRQPANTPPSDAYLNQLRKRYRQASKKERGQILDELVATSGYHRKHATALLGGKRQWRARTQPLHRQRRRIYLEADERAVLWLAELFDQVSSKRLRAAMDTELAELVKRGHLKVNRACFRRLQTISASTIDRLRRAHRSVDVRRPHRGGTKPGSLLKSQIPIRTFADWNDKRPGFTEIDLVQHDGGNPSGIFACTLTVTDVATGWTEIEAVRNKAQTHVFSALQHIRQHLPFPLLGVDSDNGAEFINDILLRYCEHEEITFTRGRVGRKNDNPFVEQKNWSVVRRLVGYDRYDSLRQVDQLNELYAVYNLYTNHFIPTTKLISKTRDGSRVIRVFDEPQTPYQRILDSPLVSDRVKAPLRAVHAQLDVVALKRCIDDLLEALFASPLPPTRPNRPK